MNFAQAVAEVITITARPDREAEIASAINSAIAYFTSRAEFARDLVEASIPIDPTAYGATIQFDNATVPLVTRFRKFKYVKAYGQRGYLLPIGADKIFTPGGIAQRNVYYVGGNNITYLLSSLAPSLEIGYYQHAPILDADTNTTYWMLDLMPWPIIDRAAARIFRSIGDDSSQAQYNASAEELFRIHKNDLEDSILAVAR